jgi:uncharacterized protein YhaN
MGVRVTPRFAHCFGAAGQSNGFERSNAAIGGIIGKQELDAADRAALETEFIEGKARFEDQDQRSRDVFSAHRKAIDQIEGLGGDDAVTKIEERRRTKLLEIEDGALRYLKLRAGIAAAAPALRVYRDRHRSSMMACASKAFQTISRGADRGLATKPDIAMALMAMLPRHTYTIGIRAENICSL